MRPAWVFTTSMSQSMTGYDPVGFPTKPLPLDSEPDRNVLCYAQGLN